MPANLNNVDAFLPPNNQCNQSQYIYNLKTNWQCFETGLMLVWWVTINSQSCFLSLPYFLSFFLFFYLVTWWFSPISRTLKLQPLPTCTMTFSFNLMNNTKVIYSLLCPPTLHNALLCLFSTMGGSCKEWVSTFYATTQKQNYKNLLWYFFFFFFLKFIYWLV